MSDQKWSVLNQKSDGWQNIITELKTNIRKGRQNIPKKRLVKIADGQASSYLTLPSYPIIRQLQSVEGDEGL